MKKFSLIERFIYFGEYKVLRHVEL